jgi:hypothetical protein
MTGPGRRAGIPEASSWCEVAVTGMVDEDIARKESRRWAVTLPAEGQLREGICMFAAMVLRCAAAS